MSGSEIHQKTCHLLFWTCTSLYKWKSQRVRTKKVDSHSFSGLGGVKRENKKLSLFFLQQVGE